jgi:hypothetical protein
MKQRPARCRSLAGIAMAVAAAVLLPAVAAAVSYQADGSLGLGLRASDNVRLASGVGDDQPVKDIAIVLAPSLSANAQAGDDRLGLSYDGEYVRYREETYDPVWIHYLQGELELRRLDPFFLTLRERRESLPRDPDRPEEDAQDYLDHNLLSLQAGLSWNVSATSRLDVSYLDDQETFPGEPGADKISSRGGRLLWEKRWTPLWRNNLSAQWRKVARETGEDYRSTGAGLEGFHRLAPRLDLDYALGWEERRYASNGRDDYWAVRASLTRHLEMGGRRFLRYEDKMEDRYDGETVRYTAASAVWTENFRDGSSASGVALYGQRKLTGVGRKERFWGPSLDFHWRVADRLALDLTGLWSARWVEEEGQSSRDNLFLAEAALVFYLGSHLVLEGGYGRLEDRAGSEEDSFREDRLWLMATATFKRIVPGQSLAAMRRLRTSHDYLGSR